VQPHLSFPQASLLDSNRPDGVFRQTVLAMSTFVTIQVVENKAGHDTVDRNIDRGARVERAFGWFRQVEACCSRFDSRSELMHLTARIGEPVPVSALLFEAVQFAVAVAAETAGAFDPAIGHTMEARGFNREHRTGQAIRTALDASGPVSYRDIELDPAAKTITLRRPLILDLGAVAKGLAIDMAARELGPLQDYSIDAGGDLYVAGCNPAGLPWSIGIRHPRQDGQLIDSIRVSNMAVCTSGDYERQSPSDASHHILDPRTGSSATDLASVTVVAPTAIVADALATAAFVLGPADGIQLLERQGVDGLAISAGLERFATPGFTARHQP
jgi:thiamine biosynthesis lipoprotein